MNNYMEKVLNEIKCLGKVKSVAWHMKEDDRPEWSLLSVRIEDTESHVVEIIRHSVLKEAFEGSEEVLVNIILAKCRIHGKWIGVNCTLSEAVECLRKEFPYVGVYFINEHDLKCICGWDRPEFIW